MLMLLETRNKQGRALGRLVCDSCSPSPFITHVDILWKMHGIGVWVLSASAKMGRRELVRAYDDLEGK